MGGQSLLPLTAVTVPVCAGLEPGPIPNPTLAPGEMLIALRWLGMSRLLFCTVAEGQGRQERMVPQPHGPG